MFVVVVVVEFVFSRIYNPQLPQYRCTQLEALITKLYIFFAFIGSVFLIKS